MDDSEPLVMTHDMKKHCDLSFDEGVDAITISPLDLRLPVVEKM
jgi:hypothetical protein